MFDYAGAQNRAAYGQPRGRDMRRGGTLDQQMQESRKAFAREMQRRLATARPAPAGQRMKAVLKAAVWIVAIILLFFLFSQVSPLVFPESPWAYALAYDTDESRVSVEPKPHNCDFLYAPIGDKGCHYERVVSVTRYGSDVRTGQPIVSYDGGKTWAALPKNQRPRLTEVSVSWHRIEGTR